MRINHLLLHIVGHIDIVRCLLHVSQCICIGIHINMYVKKRVEFSIMIIYYTTDITGYDRRRSELFDVSLHMKQGITSIEKNTDP